MWLYCISHQNQVVDMYILLGTLGAVEGCTSWRGQWISGDWKEWNAATRRSTADCGRSGSGQAKLPKFQGIGRISFLYGDWTSRMKGALWKGSVALIQWIILITVIRQMGFMNLGDLKPSHPKHGVLALGCPTFNMIHSPSFIINLSSSQHHNPDHDHLLLLHHCLANCDQSAWFRLKFLFPSILVCVLTQQGSSSVWSPHHKVLKFSPLCFRQFHILKTADVYIQIGKVFLWQLLDSKLVIKSLVLFNLKISHWQTLFFEATGLDFLRHCEAIRTTNTRQQQKLTLTLEAPYLQ